MSVSPQSLGGRVSAKKQRDAAIESYYNNPQICIYCHSIIIIKENDKVHYVRKKKFCNHSCSASYANKLRYRNKKSKREHYNQIHCSHCGDLLPPRKSQYGRKYCDKCKNIVHLGKTYINLLTKSEFRLRHKSYQSFRSTIQKHARAVYLDSKLPLICKVCRYNKTVDISHIKPVSKFSDQSLITDINSIDNLVALCPNHHWEFDHGLLTLQ